MSTIVPVISANELFRLKDDGCRTELIKGELIRRPYRDSEHGRIVANIGSLVAQHAAVNNLGISYAAGTGFQIASDPDTVLAPDVAFISRERFEDSGTVERYWRGAPDIVLEYVSAKETRSQVEEKATKWLQAGTSMVLVLDPRKRTTTVCRSLTGTISLNEDAILDLDDVVPGFKVAVKDIFD
jgi:Uma2 family endonuclease